MKSIEIYFLGEAVEEWEGLNRSVEEEQKSGITNSHKQQLLKSIRHKLDLLRCSPQQGEPVPKRLIPQQFHVDNLRVIDLSGYWRMLYTLKGSKIGIICFILRIIDHKKYDKLFGYRKR